jgi:hypothetical protein
MFVLIHLLPRLRNRGFASLHDGSLDHRVAHVRHHLVVHKQHAKSKKPRAKKTKEQN